MTSQLPVLVLGYNRPNATRDLINAIRDYKPPRIYLACDGPKNDLDRAQVAEVRLVMENEVDWACEREFRFPERNQGLRVGIAESISWFFSREPEGVVLEDDCIPSLDFFRLSEHFIENYRDSKEIWGITGNNNFREFHPDADSYQFFHVPMIWGWASWSDRWMLTNQNFKEFEHLASLGKIYWPSAAVKHALEWKLRQVSREKLDSWAFIFSWSMVQQSGLWAISNPNLIKNIGAGVDATNTPNVPAKEFEVLGSIKDPPESTVNRRAELELLRRTHRVLFPYWLNYLRDCFREIKSW